jgi:ADP-ribose pyrophosphatase YjhB (NUDIX family)
MALRDSHCSYCGARFGDADVEAKRWPRTCSGCANVSYRNPLPVACLLLPVDGGVLLIRRGIPPHVGELAVPGGYVNLGESWQEAATRELFEETSIRVPPEEVRIFDVKSAPDGTVLIFGAASPKTEASLPSFAPTDETTERVVVHAPEALAFPLHTAVVSAFLARAS